MLYGAPGQKGVSLSHRTFKCADTDTPRHGVLSLLASKFFLIHSMTLWAFVTNHGFFACCPGVLLLLPPPSGTVKLLQAVGGPVGR